jgi:hypothetical protein
LGASESDCWTFHIIPHFFTSLPVHTLPSHTNAIPGENSIVIVGGANQAEWVGLESIKDLLQGAGAVLLQREIPETVNEQVSNSAAALNKIKFMQGLFSNGMIHYMSLSAVMWCECMKLPPLTNRLE